MLSRIKQVLNTTYCVHQKRKPPHKAESATIKSTILHNCDIKAQLWFKSTTVVQAVTVSAARKPPYNPYCAKRVQREIRPKDSAVDHTNRYNCINLHRYANASICNAKLCTCIYTTFWKLANLQSLDFTGSNGLFLYYFLYYF